MFLIIAQVSFANTFTGNGGPGKIRVMFYNVENLFDTIDDPAINDSEYLPGSKLNWNSEKYNTKLQNIAYVVDLLGTEKLPDIIGLCEIENRKVLEELISQKSMKKNKFRIVHQDSPDERGIDVALLYSGKAFRLLDYKSLPVIFQDDPDDKTRDILYARLLDKKKDTIHFFVNHWPSRSGGQAKSEPKRIEAANTLLKELKNIYSDNRNPIVIIMGDFNDEPDNTSLIQVISGISPEQDDTHALVNLMARADKAGKGSYYYYYEKQWNMLDQFIVSSNLLDKNNKISLSEKEGLILDDESIMFRNNSGVLQPNRTSSGSKYFGGYSDHLPIYIDLEYRPVSR